MAYLPGVVASQAVMSEMDFARTMRSPGLSTRPQSEPQRDSPEARSVTARRHCGMTGKEAATWPK